MKYWIFGGNGFVGRYLANALLARNEQVVVCDLQDTLHEDISTACSYKEIDIRDTEGLSHLPIDKGDVVINMAANQYHTKVPKNREEYFRSVNTEGTRNLLTMMEQKGCTQYIMFSTDMTYGIPQYLPVDTKHPQNPFGPYGQSKLLSEQICREYRTKGINITIFRPRMIMGPGRAGILLKLFKLIDLNLPVPTVGNGHNHYQMISVFDCVSAVLCAIDKGVPNKEYNLGSENAPDVRSLLQNTIRQAGKHSFVLPTPGKLVKAVLRLLDDIGLTLMYPEQFMIADEEYILDISETKEDLVWQPKYNDADMLAEAYKMYQSK